MNPLALAFAPLAPLALIAVGATVLVGLGGVFLIRRPIERATWLVRILMVVALVGILIRPGHGEVPAQAKTSDLEILVVVDRTTSMSALDWNGQEPRLDGVRADLEQLTEIFPGARFSLITFGRFVRTELPYSSDAGAFLAAVEVMKREDVFDGTGSMIDTPLEEMTASLEGAAERNPDRKRLVVFASDGENTVEGDQQSFSALDGVVDAGLVIGYGTEDGGPMKVFEDDESGSYVHDDSTGADALSKIDEDNLAQVASEMGVDYQHRQEVGGLDTWADKVETTFSDDDDEVVSAHETYWWFALALFVLAMVELAIAWQGFHSARRELRR